MQSHITACRNSTEKNGLMRKVDGSPNTVEIVYNDIGYNDEPDITTE